MLLVDDDATMRELGSAWLRKGGHQVITAVSGEEALDLIREKGVPDIAIFDVELPGISGLDLTRQLRADPGIGDFPVIFLSAGVEPEQIEAGRALGATYLTKPFVASALLDAIERSLPRPGGVW